MLGTATRLVQKAGCPVLIGLAYFALAFAALLLTRDEYGIATIWPPSGILLAGLMLNSNSQRKWVLLSCALASTLANHFAGSSWLLSVGYTIANIVEAGIAMWLIGQQGRSNLAFYDPKAVGRFAAATISAGLASSLTAMLLSNDWTWSFFVSWSSTVTLGMMIITPLIVTVVQTHREQRHNSTRFQLLSGLAIFTLVAVVTSAVFHQSSYPLLFLPLVCVLIATYRMGPLGAAVSVFLIMAIGTWCTFSKAGPIHSFADGHDAGVLFFQFFLLVTLASALPLAALLAQRDRNFAMLVRSKRFLEMAEQAANVGHWNLDLLENKLFWSDETYRIHGLDKDWPINFERAINFYLPEDIAMVKQAIETAIADLLPFEFEARIRRTDGNIRNIESRGDVERDAHGKPVALFGMFQDITERIQAIKQIEASRNAAQEEARLSAILAETDQLTGLANRRKAFATLRDAIARAEVFGSDLTVAIIDVDNFKSINDTFGHTVGDSVLVQLARHCTKSLRDCDLLSRMGGEEFIVILPGATIDTAYEIAERLRARVAAIEWSYPGLESVTVSIGLANFQHGMDENALTQAADRALYQAKNDGRNLLRVAA